MSIELSPDELRDLQRFVARRARPTRRQRAQALLLLAEGHPTGYVAQTVGILLTDIETLEREFEARGMVALDRPRSRTARREYSGIVKTEGVCGGSARISGTRIPVWQLVADRDVGVSEAQLLLDYPSLRAEDLVNAWSYASSHRDEIQAEIHENEVA
jgi:uncharacterized protein (DUF433 family)